MKQTLVFSGLAIVISCLVAGSASAQDSAAEVAVEVDRLIQKELSATGVTPAAISTDEDFLRRVSFDVVGTPPSAREVTLFGLNPGRSKRAQLIDRLLASDEYAETWARYWRDVILGRATNMRAPFVNGSFVSWMTESLKENKGWDKITTEIVTASGDVREVGATALMFAQEGVSEDIAGEVSRIFLGIQMQCANCHDHPWDSWKREQFHELAAFFPRVSIRPIREEMRLVTYVIASADSSRDPQARFAELKERAPGLMRFFDRNKDGKLTKAEAGRSPLSRQFDVLLERGDKNKDGGLSLTEIKELEFPMPQQAGRGSTEHFMSDLSNPSSPGTRTDPKFFVTRATAKTGLDDLERRGMLAKYLTSTSNEWFAKAFINRMWAELTGEGFYMPIDDMGPERSASFPEVMKLLTSQFIRHRYDIKWLIRTIALTETYQRQIRTVEPGGIPFASATATRLRGDQLYNAIVKVMGGENATARTLGSRNMAGQGMYRRARDPRDQFSLLFGFDPSTPQADITGTVPQALFMMNSPQINGQIRATFGTRLAQLVRKYRDDQDAISELYLMILSREPSDKELKICREYIADVGSRNEAYEDLMWSLLNSSEFISKR
jgi:hypothetical protein